MSEPSILYPGFVGDVNMKPGLPMTGSSMDANTVNPILPGLGFASRGTGQSPVTTLSGRQGAIDLWIVTGATGTSQSLVVLTNGVANTYIELLLNTTNQVSVIHRSNDTTIVSQLTGQFAAEAAGVRMRLRYTWNSQQAIDGAHFAMLRKNEAKETSFAVDPTTPWVGFYPTTVYLGVGGVATGGNFLGTIDKVQIGSQTVTT